MAHRDEPHAFAERPGGVYEHLPEIDLQYGREALYAFRVILPRLTGAESGGLLGLESGGAHRIAYSTLPLDSFLEPEIEPAEQGFAHRIVCAPCNTLRYVGGEK